MENSMKVARVIALSVVATGFAAAQPQDEEFA